MRRLQLLTDDRLYAPERWTPKRPPPKSSVLRVEENSPRALVLVSEGSRGAVLGAALSLAGCLTAGVWLHAAEQLTSGWIFVLGSSTLLLALIMFAYSRHLVFCFDAASGYLCRQRISIWTKKSRRPHADKEKGVPLRRIAAVKLETETFPSDVGDEWRRYQVRLVVSGGADVRLTTTENPFDSIARVSRRWLRERGHLDKTERSEAAPPGSSGGSLTC